MEFDECYIDLSAPRANPIQFGYIYLTFANCSREQTNRWGGGQVLVKHA